MNREVDRLVGEVSRQARLDRERKPVVLFNASTRITGLSLNAAFQLLTGWALRLAGVALRVFEEEAKDPVTRG